MHYWIFKNKLSYSKTHAFLTIIFIFLDNSQDRKLSLKDTFGFHDNLKSENIIRILMFRFIKSKSALPSFWGELQKATVLPKLVLSTQCNFFPVPKPASIDKTLMLSHQPYFPDVSENI